jgi:hypothetical protein
MRTRRYVCVCLSVFLCVCDIVHVYKHKHTHQETYSYYTLPFCKPDADKVTTRWAGLGEALEGNSLVQSNYAISFGQGLNKTFVCTMRLDAQAHILKRHSLQCFYRINTPGH